MKGVKKIFRKTTKFIRRYWKEILIAAAIVFTVGVAAGYFGAAAAGGSAAGAVGAVATPAVATGTTAAAVGVTAAKTAALALAAASPVVPLAAVTVVAPAIVGTTLGTKIAIGALAGGGVAAFSKAAAAVSPQTATPPEATPKTVDPKTGFVSRAKKAGANIWGGLSSFEKVTLLATGVNMAAAATARKSKEGEFPMAHQFYGRDKEGRGAGVGFDYDKAAGKMVPADSRFIARPEQAGPVGTQQADTRSSVPDPFIQAPPKGGGQMSSFTPDNDDLKKRLDFVQKGYDSGDYSGGTG